VLYTVDEALPGRIQEFALGGVLSLLSSLFSLFLVSLFLFLPPNISPFPYLSVPLEVSSGVRGAL